jgi:hypothetical protein
MPSPTIRTAIERTIARTTAWRSPQLRALCGIGIILAKAIDPDQSWEGPHPNEGDQHRTYATDQHRRHDTEGRCYGPGTELSQGI